MGHVRVAMVTMSRDVTAVMADHAVGMCLVWAAVPAVRRPCGRRDGVGSQTGVWSTTEVQAEW